MRSNSRLSCKRWCTCLRCVRRRHTLNRAGYAPVGSHSLAIELSAWTYQIPWQISLAAVVGYAVVYYVPDKPLFERSLFPAPYSRKPLALLTLSGTLSRRYPGILNCDEPRDVGIWSTTRPGPSQRAYHDHMFCRLRPRLLTGRSGFRNFRTHRLGCSLFNGLGERPSWRTISFSVSF